MTAQASEVLEHNGVSLSLCSNPLSSYLDQRNFEFQVVSTACWRGYIGYWSITENKLYLNNIEGYLKNGEKVSLKTIFPNHTGKVFADWYSGELRCPQGKLIDYVHGGYASTYEKDLFITIKDGIVISEKYISNGVSDKKMSTGYKIAAFLSIPVRKKDAAE